MRSQESEVRSLGRKKVPRVWLLSAGGGFRLFVVTFLRSPGMIADGETRLARGRPARRIS
jgi:hypothetical protein